jgi:hypothetical protein
VVIRVQQTSGVFLAAVIALGCAAPAAPSETPADMTSPPVATISPTSGAGATPSPPASPNVEAEALLLAGIRADTEVACASRRVELPAGAVAVVECLPDTDLVRSAAFYLFEVQDTFMDAYFAKVAENGLTVGSGPNGSGLGEGAYFPDGQGSVFPPQRYAMWLDSAGVAHYLTTLLFGNQVSDTQQTGPFVLVEVDASSGDWEALFDWAYLGSIGEPSTPSLWRPPRFIHGAIAQVVTTDLVVRSAPGTGPESRIYQERLASPTLLYVFDGPVAADGYDWYLVLPRNLSFLPSGYHVGWVAAAGKDGEAWIGDATPQCPEPTLEDIVALSDVAMLACFGSQSLGLEGWISTCSARDPAIASPYIWASRCSVEDSGYPVDVVPSPGGLEIWFDGDIGAQPSAESRLSRITGHFDDLRSATCPNVIPADIYPGELQAMDFKPPPGWGVFQCRTAFVAASAEVISTP